MRKLSIGLLVSLMMLPVCAQSAEQKWVVSNAEWDGCIGILADKPPPVRVRIENCTRLIDGTRLEAMRRPLAYLHRGTAYIETWQYDKAISDLTLAIAALTKENKRTSELAQAYEARAVAYDGEGLYDKAIDDYSKAILLGRKTIVSYNNRAWDLHKKGQDAKALIDANKAVAIEPDNAAVIETRGEIYEKLGRRDAAIADFRKALRFDPTMKSAKDGLKRLGVAP
jgi:tetratricopeptide (TPR) repeat protein